jgi:hypothetical protein
MKNIKGRRANDMSMEQQLLYLNKNYKILSAEQEYIVHPAVFDLVPLSAASLQCSFISNFQLKDYRLTLDKLLLGNVEAMNLAGIKSEVTEKKAIFQDLSVSYTGAILIGADLVKEYFLKGNLACFSYQSVFELVFEDGVLITTIDQSKAMLRIRKNIELGFRSLYNNRDIRCIKHFMNSSLVGDYKAFKFNTSRLKYVKDMKKDYRPII